MTLAYFRQATSVDLSLSALLLIQAVTLFVAIPLGTAHPAAHLLLDICHLSFALVCVVALTRHRLLQLGLLVALVLLAAGPGLSTRLVIDMGLDGADRHELIAFTAFAFNAAVTVLVARHVFGPGRVTGHRVQGAILIYLNLAALFAILYSAIATHLPGAIVQANGALLPADPAARNATLTYFSLSALTTAGFGDIAPIHPLARSLVNLESVVGQLFPATLLARIVALHLAHSDEGGAPKD